MNLPLLAGGLRKTMHTYNLHGRNSFFLLIILLDIGSIHREGNRPPQYARCFANIRNRNTNDDD